MSKKNAILLLLMLSAISGFSQITVSGGVVPQYVQGDNGTNNDRTPFWCWLDLTGLTPGATYRYYTVMDSLTASPTSNGAGNTYMVNMASGTVRRTANSSLSNSANYDSLVADSSGTYSGWFGIEPTGNGRYTAGNTLYVKLIMNNGAGGTSIANRVMATAFPVSVIDYGTTNAAIDGSALYDSSNTTAKNFMFLFDNVAATGRPLSIAIVEDDGMDLFAITSITPMYRNSVDTMPMHWGTIVPNSLATGVRALEEHAFADASQVDLVTDADGWWCSGVNTALMTSGNSSTYLNSTFVLSSTASIPDTVWVGLSANFNVTTNDPNATITWDYGDSNSGSGAMTSHTYTSAGVVSVTVVVSNGGCTDTIWQNVIVELGMTIPRQIQLGFDVSPNPSSGIFYVSTRSAIEKEVQVFDVLGTPIYTTTFTGVTGELDLSGLQKGVYFMRISENVGGGKTATKRIVIQ